MIDQLKQFLSERPALSKSGVCREAKISTQQLNYILRGERGLTDNVKNKLIPVLKKYGYAELSI